MNQDPQVQPQPTPAPAPQPPQAQAVAQPEQGAAQPNSTYLLEASIEYGETLMARPRKAIARIDQAHTLTVSDAQTGELLLSQPVSNIKKVTRMEYALYVSPQGKKTCALLFGNAKQYVAENGALMGVGGIVGTAISQVRSNQQNKASGLEDWVTYFQQQGKIRNFSPNNLLIWAIPAAIVLLIVVALFTFS